MMIGMFGYLTGYDGKFSFESPGQKYNETQYLGMRLVLITYSIIKRILFISIVV